MTPADILKKRTEYYRTLDPAGIFGLYADESEFRKFFPELSVYVDHFNKLTIDHETPTLEIFREKEEDDTAEVMFLETFKSLQGVRQFYSKSTLVRRDGEWKIVKEIREEKVR